jgi:anti-sigma-K factor RskA
VSIDIHALSGAYAVGAVDDLERAQFERHLAECRECRAEVASLREAAALLPETTAQAAPAALRDAVLGSIETVRPLPPVVVAAAERGRSTRRRFLALAAAAVALIALGVAGATVVDLVGDDGPSSTSVAQRVLDAPDATTYSARLDGGDRLEVVYSADLDQAVIQASGLDPLPDGQVYQLWLDQDDEMVPAGFLDDPTAPAVLHGDVSDAASANITIEDAEGAQEPDLENVVGAVELGQA